LKKFFVLPALPSNEKTSFDHHNSYNKGPNLAFFSFTKSPSNSLLTIKFPKNHFTSSYHSNMPKTAMAKTWPLMGFMGYYTASYSYLLSSLMHLVLPQMSKCFTPISCTKFYLLILKSFTQSSTGNTCQQPQNSV
jgi:hypothetical protein